MPSPEPPPPELSPLLTSLLSYLPSSLLQSLKPTSLLPLLLLTTPSSPSATHSHLALTTPPTPLHYLTTLIPSLTSHLPFTPTSLNQGEYPATAALTSGYVFRIENEATVWFLQSISSTGKLTHINVGRPGFRPQRGTDVLVRFGMWNVIAVVSVVLGSWGWESGVLRRWEVVGALGCILQARVVQAVLLGGRARREMKNSWKGAKEEGLKSTLLVLLSSDRWVRLDGQVDDVKAVTSGRWIAEETEVEAMMGLASSLVYMLGVVLLCGVDLVVQVVVVGAAVLNYAVMMWQTSSNSVRESGMKINDRYLTINEQKGRGGITEYGRRTEMADELIKEFGRRDWAEQLGMVTPQSGKKQVVTM